MRVGHMAWPLSLAGWRSQLEGRKPPIFIFIHEHLVEQVHVLQLETCVGQAEQDRAAAPMNSPTTSPECCVSHMNDTGTLSSTPGSAELEMHLLEKRNGSSRPQVLQNKILYTRPRATAEILS